MSIFGYVTSLKLGAEDPPFDALIMAAMRKADTDNLKKLRDAWPHIYHEMTARYHAPGGILSPEEAKVYQDDSATN